MLAHLMIENIAVIERADIEFGSGFCVLTGETGAGKSILIDAIHAVMGERTSRELIRTGASRAMVSALFCGCAAPVYDALRELGFEPEEDGSVLLQRTLSADGRSVCRIGGRPATAGMLRQVCRLLIDIHGQHDNQALLDPDSHLAFLDAFAGHDALIARYRDQYHLYRRLYDELNRCRQGEEEKARRADVLSFQIAELEEADVRPGERQELRLRRDALLSSEKLAAAAAQAAGLLCGDEDTDGAADRLISAGGQLMECSAHPGAVSLGQRLSEIGYELKELGSDAEATADEAQFSQTELDEIEERLNLYHKLSKKYGETEADMLSFLEQARAELAGIESAEERAAEIEQRMDTEGELLQRLSDELSASRRNAGERLSQKICEELAFLDMPQVRFAVSVASRSLTARGGDRVEFLISANAGEEPRPLSKIASGGELSRIMLSIKRVLAELDVVDTLIFDEIDTGISGRAAQKVGRTLHATAGAGRQVVCVTHLAQIAAMGDQHLLIKKSVEDGRTYTRVSPLDGERRVRELARIIGGEPVTPATMNSAQEMLERGAVQE